FSSRRRHTRFSRDWSSDVCSSDLGSARVVSSGNYFRADGTADGVLNFPEGSNYTISAWVNSSTLPGHGTIVSKHDNAYALKMNRSEERRVGKETRVSGQRCT